jgi:tRNA modification GTPase
LSYHLKDIEIRLIKLLTLAEASFEFLEEEQRDLNMEQMFKGECTTLQEHMRELLLQFSQQQQVRQGVRVVIVGRVNAGKSTLFNALVKKDRAIVTDVAGTTRDSIEVSLYKGGIFWALVDTAGLRHTQDALEQQGIERTFAEAAAADVVLLVFDATVPIDDHDQLMYRQLIGDYGQKIIVVFNKIDSQKPGFIAHLPGWGEGLACMAVSAQEKWGLEDLESAVDAKIQALFTTLRSPYLLTQRQARLISEIERNLDFIVKSFSDVLHYELIAYHLKESLEKIAELTGRNVTEQMLDAVFNGFCVGK